VDGAGGFQATTSALSDSVTEAGIPLRVELVEWTHGYGRVLADQTDFEHARCQGQRLAALVAERIRASPEQPVYIVGHSAGSAVALAAAESLPRDSLARVILLAPSVSADYDLRPALASARGGIDVFYSPRDVGYLGVGVAVVGTADRQWGTPAAGRTGFRAQIHCPGDAELYARLRQHPWDRSIVWTGNRGGHYDGYKPGYLRAYVLPLLCPGPCSIAAMPVGLAPAAVHPPG
jgi:pimeloyl-ACP methyl ester carboxylesterase